jgi:hypothetical protein
MTFLSRSIDNVSELTFWPGIIFPLDLEEYINEPANIYSIHADSFGIILINCVTVTIKFSHVFRTNSLYHKLHTNLYNIIVARSCKFKFVLLRNNLRIFDLAYGKSELTKFLRDMLNTVATYRPTKLRSSKQVTVAHPINVTLNEMSKAGLMTGLDDCRL